MENILLRDRKADMHIKEMIFMIIGLTVFFSIVLLFYLTYSMSNVKTNLEASKQAGAIMLAEGLAGSPEFSCPSDLSRGVGICIDSDKILAMISSNKEYARFWSNDISGLRIEKANMGNGTVNCTAGNYERCNTFIIIPNKPGEIQEFASYATLCKVDSVNGEIYPRCELAKIIVAAEKKT